MKRRLWIGNLLAPLAWVIAFELNYTLVPFACQSRQIWLLHVIFLVALAAAAIGAMTARTAWVATGRQMPGEGETPESRDRFLGMFGMVFSASMMLLIVAQWIPVLFLDPCIIG
jgi:hypothetical protein